MDSSGKSIRTSAISFPLSPSRISLIFHLADSLTATNIDNDITVGEFRQRLRNDSLSTTKSTWNTNSTTLNWRKKRIQNSLTDNQWLCSLETIADRSRDSNWLGNVSKALRRIVNLTQLCIIGYSLVSPLNSTVKRFSSTVYSPFLAIFLIVPLALGGKIIRCSLIKEFSSTLPHTSPPAIWSPSFIVGSNFHFFSRSSAGTEIPRGI